MDDAMKFFMTNIDNWGVVEHFDRLVSAVKEHDKCVVDGKEESERELYQNIFTSQALHIAREYPDVIRESWDKMTDMSHEHEKLAQAAQEVLLQHNAPHFSRRSIGDVMSELEKALTPIK